jgi:outer membrane protein
MPRNTVIALALAAAFAASTAHADGFKATVGYENVNPKSKSGQIAGAESRINDKWGATGSLAYGFDDHWSAEVWTGLSKFKHDVALDGAGTVARLEHRPTTLSVDYHFLPEGKVNPFVGVGYGWVNVSGEQGVGVLNGADVRAKDGKGVAFTVGADVALTDKVFLRGSARRLNWESDVAVNGVDVGSAKVDPWVYGVSAGLKF